MALFLVLALAVLAGQVQCQRVDDDGFYEEPEFGLQPQRDQTASECYSKTIDFYLILDSSTSIYVNDYRQELQFARDLVSRLDIGPRTTRVGILTFSDDITRPPLELNRFTNKNDLLASITEQNLPYRTGVTNTDLAIRYVRENTSFRDGITKIIIVLTDGGSRSPGSTQREADLAREKGFYLYVIGMGQYQDEREWRYIASDPDDSFLYNITSARGLDYIKNVLPPNACVLPPLEVSRRCNVERTADVFFVAGPGGSYDALQIIDRLAEATTDSGNYLRVSYLLGACSNAENVPFSNTNRYCDRSQTFAPVTSDAYTNLLMRLRSIARQSRPRNAKQLAVLFMDEETIRTNRFGVLNEVRNVGDVDNIDIIVVDLGLRGYASSIQGMVSNRDNMITFSPGGVSSQRSVLNTLIDRLCVVINGADFDFGFTPS